MTIEFSCSHCDKVLKTSDDKAGRRAKCPQCGEAVTVPDPTADVSADDVSGVAGWALSLTEVVALVSVTDASVCTATL